MTPHTQNIPYGYCHCGCGHKTTVAEWDNTKNGHIKGVPKRYIHNHHVVKPRPPTGGPFKIEGETCFLVPLTRGQWMIISGIVLSAVTSKGWVAVWSHTVESYYAARKERIDGKATTVYLHKEILGLGQGRVRRGDHENGVTLDNRIDNLRPASNTESARNKGKYSNNTSGFKGVSYHIRKRKWGASIRVDGVLKCLGYFDTREEAYAAYCEAAVFYFGEFARLA